MGLEAQMHALGFDVCDLAANGSPVASMRGLWKISPILF